MPLAFSRLGKAHILARRDSGFDCFTYVFKYLNIVLFDRLIAFLFSTCILCCLQKWRSVLKGLLNCIFPSDTVLIPSKIPERRNVAFVLQTLFSSFCMCCQLSFLIFPLVKKGNRDWSSDYSVTLPLANVFSKWFQKIITCLHLTRGQLSKIDYILIITFVLSVIRSILLHCYKGWQLKCNASVSCENDKPLFKHPRDGLAASIEFVFWYPNTTFRGF